MLTRNGWRKAREGGNYTIYTNGREIEAVARHVEIGEGIARAIIKRRGLK
jgi:hypothetical protein